MALSDKSIPKPRKKEQYPFAQIDRFCVVFGSAESIRHILTYKVNLVTHNVTIFTHKVAILTHKVTILTHKAGHNIVASNAAALEAKA